MCRDKEVKTGHRVVPSAHPANLQRSAPILRANLKADVRGLLVGIRHQKNATAPPSTAMSTTAAKIFTAIVSRF